MKIDVEYVADTIIKTWHIIASTILCCVIATGIRIYFGSAEITYTRHPVVADKPNFKIVTKAGNVFRSKTFNSKDKYIVVKDTVKGKIITIPVSSIDYIEN